MLNIAKAVFGGIMLFLGRDMDWLFSIGIGLLVGLKMTALLQANTPLWMVLLLVLAIGAIGALPYVIYPESKYLVTGFLVGGYIVSEYLNNVLYVFLDTVLTGSTWLAFFVGAVIGAVFLVVTKEWGLMLSSALIGAFLIADLFINLPLLTATLIASGLFILGGIVQIVIMRMQQADDVKL